MLTISDEFDLINDPHILNLTTGIITNLPNPTVQCVWDKMIPCNCLNDHIKMDELEEQKAKVTDCEMDDRKMRDLLMNCVVDQDSIARSVGINTSTCLEEKEEVANTVLDNFIKALNDTLGDEAKQTLTNLTSGNESSAEKLNIIFQSDFATSSSLNILKEQLQSFIDLDLSDTDDIKCLYDNTLNSDSDFVTCAHRNAPLQCISPDDVQFVMNEECAEVMLSQQCTGENVVKIAHFQNTGGVQRAVKDNKLSIADGDCMQDGEKVMSFKDIVSKSDKKIGIQDKAKRIEECDIKKLEEEAEEARESQMGVEVNPNSTDQANSETDQALQTNLDELIKKMTIQVNMIISDINYDQIKKAGEFVKSKIGGDIDEDIDATLFQKDSASQNLSIEKDSFMACPDNIMRSSGINPNSAEVIFKLK